MALDPITAALDIGSKIIDKIFPDKQAADAAKLKLLEMRQTGELAQMANDTTLAQGQNEVNKIEAASTRLFVAGWRPFIGWICGVAFGFKYIAGPLLVTIGSMWGMDVKLPVIDASELLPILLGMLGLGVMRTAEKVRGVA
jgi:hypothetical protein